MPLLFACKKNLIFWALEFKELFLAMISFFEVFCYGYSTVQCHKENMLLYSNDLSH